MPGVFSRFFACHDLAVVYAFDAVLTDGADQ